MDSKKIKISLSGIDFSRKSSIQKAQSVKYIESTEEIFEKILDTPTLLIKPPPNAHPGNGPKFLSRALANKNKSFQDKLDSLPPPPKAVDYSDVAPEQFGEAALKGMGWKGPGTALRKDGPIKAAEYRTLPSGVGLGYSSESEHG